MRTPRATIGPTLLRAAVGTALIVTLAGCGSGSGDEPSTDAPSGSGTATADPSGDVTDDATDQPADEETTDGAGEDPTEVPTTDTGTDAPDLEDVPTAEVGACLNLVDLMGGDGVSELPTVDCTVEHDAQVFALVTLPDGEYPGEESLAASIAELCRAEFEAFVGTAPADSALELDGLGPSPESWAVGDREIVCLAFHADLSTTTESFEGSGL